MIGMVFYELKVFLMQKSTKLNEKHTDMASSLRDIINILKQIPNFPEIIVYNNK